MNQRNGTRCVLCLRRISVADHPKHRRPPLYGFCEDCGGGRPGAGGPAPTSRQRLTRTMRRSQLDYYDRLRCVPLIPSLLDELDAK